MDILQIQFDLAMSIGNSLDLRDMLRESTGSFLRTLDCAAAAVYLQGGDGVPVQLAFAIPKDPARNPACAGWAELSQSAANEPGNSQTVLGDGGVLICLPLPGVGWFVLQRHSPLDAPVLHALTPIQKKLARACVACQQREAHDALLQSTLRQRSLYQSLMESLPIIVFALDANGIFVNSDGAGLAMLGRKSGEVIGRSIRDVYAETPQILKHVQLALAGTQTRALIHVQGRLFDGHYEPLRAPDGSVSGVIGLALDVTDAQLAMRRMDAVLNSVGEGIVTANEAGKIVMVNRECERIFGHPPGSMVGLDLSDLMPPKYKEAHSKGMLRYINQGEARVIGKRIELEGARLDGTPFPLEIYISETVVGATRLFTAAIRDLTDRKHYEQMRENFVATVSHELRTPLASIKGWTETLLSGRTGPLNSDQHRFLGIIETSSQRLETLVAEILTFSRIQRGVLEINRVSFDPLQLVQQVVDALRPQAERAGIAMDVACTGTGNVFADPARISQVLTNVLANAIKFGRANGRASVSSHVDAGRWRVQVADNGIGIPFDELPNLFKQFYRARTALRAQVMGTGIGLYICKSIVEAHQGRIDLSSVEGEGTTLWFEIPQPAPQTN